MDRICLHLTVFFFFSSRRRHTRSLRDWSSDVCSSDLTRRRGGPVAFRHESHFSGRRRPDRRRRPGGAHPRPYRVDTHVAGLSVPPTQQLRLRRTARSTVTGTKNLAKAPAFACVAHAKPDRPPALLRPRRPARL